MDTNPIRLGDAGSESTSFACSSRGKSFTFKEYESMSDDELALHSKENSRDAFTVLIRRYQSPIKNYIRRMVENEQDSEDLTQECFVKAYRSLHRFDEKYRFPAWIYTIAKRTALNHFRSHKPTEEMVFEPEDVSKRPDQCSETNEDTDSLWALVSRLKPKQSEAIFLYYQREFSVKEIAEIMNKSQMNVKVLLFRARAELKKRMKVNRSKRGEFMQ